MSESNYIKKVAIVGATGNLGGNFLEALLATGKHELTAITRHESKATFPSGVKVARVDYTDQDSLVGALRGHDFLVITLGVRTAPETHSQICTAAGKAGIPYIMPNAYGYDIRNTKLQEESLYAGTTFKNIQDVKDAGVNFIAMCCGFWYEWSLALGEQWLGFDIRKRTATFVDDGTTKVNVSTWKLCGRALAALLSLPIKAEKPGQPALENWKNEPFLISSFLISQRDMLDSLNRVLGTSDKDWTIKYENHEERYKNGLAEMQAGVRTGYAKAMYTRCLYPNGGADYETENGVANAELGLEKDDLDEATKTAVDMLMSGWLENLFRGYGHLLENDK